jgi:hypothetical protein
MCVCHERLLNSGRPGNVDKSSRRLARKAELARESRRRKKVYVSVLEEKVQQMTERIAELELEMQRKSLNLTYSPLTPEGHEGEQICSSASEMVSTIQREGGFSSGEIELIIQKFLHSIAKGRKDTLQFFEKSKKCICKCSLLPELKIRSSFFAGQVHSMGYGSER